ncbi:hypothetical protein [Acaryochloris sp. CCMEE 5410]|uniref:hypothetical protein n=1 Tax=Acaryochloris sp. CCMEE 5410 TaxID=310037 RepID=UPI0002484675|nr:hypothetical protein [Acaryochloris sp. CCMEE 5410]KAI9131297.1 hypothetical protein ON05_027025 [Acaryochloris sp. CCMEE 5410]
MSVDWFIHCFENQESKEFRLSRLSQAFKKVGKKEYFIKDTIWWELDCGSSMTAGKRGLISTDAIVIDRPALVPELLVAIFDLLKDEGMVLFSADLDTPFVANPKTRQHLPNGMVKALGEPKFLDSLKKIEESI